MLHRCIYLDDDSSVEKFAGRKRTSQSTPCSPSHKNGPSSAFEHWADSYPWARRIIPTPSPRQRRRVMRIYMFGKHFTLSVIKPPCHQYFNLLSHLFRLTG
jgi:hypothetical protein